uniref:Uncharacterized protein n=1 Tax=Anguilla anguilla TaxID=7936 RepID=A0A0E9UKB5_ANGAN
MARISAAGLALDLSTLT